MTDREKPGEGGAAPPNASTEEERRLALRSELQDLKARLDVLQEEIQALEDRVEALD